MKKSSFHWFYFLPLQFHRMYSIDTCIHFHILCVALLGLLLLLAVVLFSFSSSSSPSLPSSVVVVLSAHTFHKFLYIFKSIEPYGKRNDSTINYSYTPTYTHSIMFVCISFVYSLLLLLLPPLLLLLRNITTSMSHLYTYVACSWQSSKIK